MARKPVIGVTGPASGLPLGWWFASLNIRQAGGIALRLTSKNLPRYRKRKLHGLVIGGGTDIDSSLYGESQGKAPKDPQRDAFEMQMAQASLDAGLPILGICRGAQLINVVKGGSLYPDIRPLRQRTSNRRTPLPRKTALSTRRGLLDDIFQQQSRWRINSLHHQAIRRLGKGLKVAARDLDGFVQAIESEHQRFVLGVQWHPEYLPYKKDQRAIFQRLIKEARRQRPRALQGSAANTRASARLSCAT